MKDIALNGDYEKLRSLVFKDGLQAVIEIYKEKYPELNLSFATVMWIQYRQFPLIIQGKDRNIVIRWEQ